MVDGSYLTGRFLLSLPGMDDPRFSRSVIAICLHDRNGAFGIDIAHRHQLVGLSGIYEQLGEDVGKAAGDVLDGGPVEPQRGFLIHGLERRYADTMDIAGKWGLTASPDILSDIARGEGPEQWVFALGYSGWGEGQLEAEMTHNGWLAANIDYKQLFAAPVEERWSLAYRMMGVDPAALGTAFGSS